MTKIIFSSEALRFGVILFSFLAIACGQKKILVMASGKISIKGNAVSVEAGNTHSEEIFLLGEDELVVKNDAGNKAIPVPANGFYLLNLKNDTLVGSYRAVAAGAGKTLITQDELQKSIDSLQALSEGRNVSAASRNFFIIPGGIAMVTENTSADIIGPFRKLPTTFEGGREYEIYKFYTNKEIREVIASLKQKQ